jgi:hypothetical protein
MAKGAAHVALAGARRGMGTPRPILVAMIRVVALSWIYKREARNAKE